MKRPQTELKQDIEAAAKQVSIGATYVHYKSAGMRYRVIDFAINTDDDEVCVIYKSLYDEHVVFARPLSEWLDVVEVNGIKMKRFTLEN